MITCSYKEVVKVHQAMCQGIQNKLKIVPWYIAKMGH